ncbi:hypothetical protein IB260_19270 [Pseudomonas sp. PDM23]|uniref:hypothetical protein n=1 Tax=unclassified Pseudomonas TaxID=196821 RepID=UPI00177E2536|nr:MULTISPECIES: hypothetical protein [unclassified Pseudomonas]MBD9577471.1 hypothetical protein [Pseudomonas sp. PDM23]MBD9670956.1 hypothetical protein [Pseudomonas sp. PDM21]
MKVVKNCWNLIETYNCQYGAHVFDGVDAKIYVNHWLDVDDCLREEFSRRNDSGFVGHCLLVFRGVKDFTFDISMHTGKDGQVVWGQPVRFNYSGNSMKEINMYSFEGSLHGFPSAVKVSVRAEGFELHILGKDEPAKEG